MIQPNFQVLDKARLGTDFKKGNDFLPALRQAGITIMATDLINQLVWTPRSKEKWVEPVIISETELGFVARSHSSHREDVLSRGKELGLFECPPDFGFYFRLQYLEQPVDDYLLIAMVAARRQIGSLGILYVTHSKEHGLTLNSSDGYPLRVFQPNYRWVFVRPVTGVSLYEIGETKAWCLEH